MRKTVIILSVLALIASGCKQKTTSENQMTTFSQSDMLNVRYELKQEDLTQIQRLKDQLNSCPIVSTEEVERFAPIIKKWTDFYEIDFAQARLVDVYSICINCPGDLDYETEVLIGLAFGEEEDTDKRIDVDYSPDKQRYVDLDMFWGYEEKNGKYDFTGWDDCQNIYFIDRKLKFKNRILQLGADSRADAVFYYSNDIFMIGGYSDDHYNFVYIFDIAKHTCSYYQIVTDKVIDYTEYTNKVYWKEKGIIVNEIDYTYMNTVDTKTQDPVKAEQEIIKLFQEGDAQASEVFKDLIINNPETMEYPFDKLQESTDYISVIESSDHNLRIYRSHTWVCLNGCEYNIFQYKNEGKVFMRQNIWFHAYVCWDVPKSEYVSDIKTVNVAGKTYYLIFAGKYNCGDYGVSEFGVTAFTIENNMLQTTPLFKYQDKILPNIFVCAIVDNAIVLERNYTLDYDKNNQILYIPETKNDHGFHYLTGLWLNYQLKGTHFEYTGKSGPYYLHASIRDFEYFVVEMDTENYHHRIDILDKELRNYRLSLWKKGKTVDSKPDLVLEGICDVNKNIFIFEKDGTTYKYPYPIWEDGNFIIEKNGKVTANEKIDRENILQEQ